MSSQNKPVEWSEGLRLVSFCPVCETRYNPMQAQILGKDGETHLLHVQCKKCRNSILALVLVSQVGASSVGLLTDLTYDDVVRFKMNREVTIDDVIDIHEFFEQGDLTGFFSKKAESFNKTVIKRTQKNIQ